MVVVLVVAVVSMGRIGGGFHGGGFRAAVLQAGRYVAVESALGSALLRRRLELCWHRAAVLFNGSSIIQTAYL
jgi:hypothetical protein